MGPESRLNNQVGRTKHIIVDGGASHVGRGTVSFDLGSTFACPWWIRIGESGSFGLLAQAPIRPDEAQIYLAAL